MRHFNQILQDSEASKVALIVFEQFVHDFVFIV